MSRESERTRDVGETMDDATDPRNTIPLRDPEEAGKKLATRIENDEPLVDVETSNSYEFSQQLKSRFKDFL